MARPTELGIAAVMAGCIVTLPGDGAILIANDATGAIGRDISARLGIEKRRLITWHRRLPASVRGALAAPWPHGGPYAAAIVRLPKARAEYEMTLHAVASVLTPDAPLWLYGANDEGIKSAAKPMAALLGAVTVADTRNHCRVLVTKRPPEITGLRPRLADWRQTMCIEIAGESREFVTYPGLFAQGRLDAGTHLLLENLPELRPASDVLDFGTGMGIVAAAVRARWPEARLTLVDTDAVALEAARENVPDALYETGLGAARPESLDAILSNPPIHDGKQEDHGALQDLIRRAPGLLRRGGTFEIVVQRRVGASSLVREALGECTVVAEDDVFQVLCAIRR